MHRLLALVTLAALCAAAPAADPPKDDVRTKRIATVERVKLIGLGGLLDQHAVRKDIGLTPDQEAKYNTAVKEMEKQLKAMHISSQAAMQKGDVELTALQRMTEDYSDCVLAVDGVVEMHLTADQLYRLKQIQLQRDGPNALLGRHAIRELALTVEQEDKIAEALKRWNKPKMSDLSQAVAVSPEEPRVAKLLAALAADLDAAREGAMKHLTAEQKAKWKEMTGEELPTVCLLVSTPQGYLFRQGYKLAK